MTLYSWVEKWATMSPESWDFPVVTGTDQQTFGTPRVMNLGTGPPQFPYVLEPALMPIGRCRAMSEGNSKDDG